MFSSPFIRNPKATRLPLQLLLPSFRNPRILPISYPNPQLNRSRLPKLHFFMDNTSQDKDASSMVIPSILNSYPSIHLEIRLFYVRFAPCAIESLPSQLKLRHLHREVGVSLEINGSRIPDLNPASVTLKRDRINKESREVTYLSTDSVRITGSVEFEVLDDEDVVLCGSLERMDDNYWSNGGMGFEKDVSGRWSMECYAANSFGSGWKSGASAPTIEVYIAGRCSGSPVILTKTIEVSLRRKNSRHGALDAIPEDEEVEKEPRTGNGSLCRSNSQISEAEVDDYETETKYRHGLYSQEMYMGEDGEMSWFNAGVRVGVGISLGVCVGVGIGVGLLMRSYQATTRNFRRRFF